jgi:hypothetical protein
MAETSHRLRIHWFDDGIACIDCLCGHSPEMMIHLEPHSSQVNQCNSCGRRYQLKQSVEVVPGLPPTPDIEISTTIREGGR